MKKSKPLGFNLFDGTSSSSEEDEPPKDPSKGNPSFAGAQSTITSPSPSYAKQEEAPKPPDRGRPRFTAATAAPALTSSHRAKAEEQPKPFYYTDATSYVSPPASGVTYGAPVFISTKQQPSHENSSFGRIQYPNKRFEEPQPIDKNDATTSSVEPRHDNKPWRPQFGSLAATSSRSAEKPKRFTSYDDKTDEEHEIIKTPSKGNPTFAGAQSTTTSAAPSYAKQEPLQVTHVNQQSPHDDLPSVQPMSTLIMALYAMPQKDFYFKLQNNDKVYADKNVLAARSRYFYREFYEVPGSSINFVNVDTFDKQIVDLAVKACYDHVFDEATLGEHVADQLFKFATKYNIPCVMALLPKTVSKHFITEANVCTVAMRAFEAKDVELCRKCAAFIAELITQGKDVPPGVENLPSEFDKEIVLAIVAKSKK